MRCHEEDEDPEMSGARTEVAGPRARFRHRRSPARASDETGNGRLEQDRDGCATLEVPDSRENDGSAARTSPARRRLGVIERLATAGSSGKTSLVRLGAAPASGLTAEPRVFGWGNRRDEREDHRPAASRLGGHRNSDASTSSRWDRRRRNRAGGWSPPRRISSTLGYTK